MPHDQLNASLAAALEGRRLLAHPFYTRWVAGDISRDEIRAYAEQYRHFEATFPRVLATVIAGMDESPARAALQRNHDDETGVTGRSHLELFDAFADSVGADTLAPATQATEHLLDIYRDLAGRGAVAGITALLAYETQVPDVAAAKSAALRTHQGLDGAAVEFWDVHSGLDREHADWAIDSLAVLGASPEEVRDAAAPAASAWWAFLDEREAARPQPLLTV